MNVQMANSIDIREVLGDKLPTNEQYNMIFLDKNETKRSKMLSYIQFSPS